MKTLLIIDGNAMLHRAFHAIPPLNSPDGTQVNAIYGFFSILLKIVEQVNPTYLAVCFDRPKPTFRKALYAGYQAHRPVMADDLSKQIGMLHEALVTVGIQIFEMDGYEADDVIGTLAYQSVQHTVAVKIVTGDRDLLQLVNSQVHILFPTLGISNMTEYDEGKVVEKFGIKPSQFIDYKALIGDSSDGYPGVTGIGPKTAVSLLKEFTSFENLYKHINDVPRKSAEKLATDAEQAALAKKLATIITDVPITLHIQECETTTISKEKLDSVFDQFAFNSLKKRLVSSTVIKSEKEKQGLQMSLL